MYSIIHMEVPKVVYSQNALKSTHFWCNPLVYSHILTKTVLTKCTKVFMFDVIH